MPLAASAFLGVQLQCLALRDVSHSGCAAENTPLRQIVLHLSELNRHFTFLVQKYEGGF